MPKDIAPPSESPRSSQPRVRESSYDLRNRYKQFCENYGDRGPELYAAKLCEQVGLIDDKGRPFTDPRTGTIALNPNRKMESESISPEHLMYAILGPECRNYLDPQQGGNFLSPSFLKETAAPAIGPSALANITAFKTGITGLYMAKMLESYESAEFVVGKLPGVDPMAPGTPQNQRLINVVGSGLPAPQFDPSQGHPAFRLDDMFVYTDKPLLKGGKIMVNKLTAFHDITGGKILQEAAGLGYSIALAEELDAIHVLTGNKNNFTMGFTDDLTASSYNTYNATAVDFASYFYVNSHANNPTDYRNLGLNLDLLSNMKHPKKRTPIMVPAANTVAVVPLPSMKAALMECNAPQTMRRFDNQAAVGTKQPGVAYMGPQNNPYAGSFGSIVESAWLRFILSNTSGAISDSNPYGGLGLTEGTTAMRWYHGDFNKGIKKRVGWNINPVNIAPNSVTAADYLVDFGLFVDAYYHYQVVCPWAMIENKQA